MPRTRLPCLLLALCGLLGCATQTRTTGPDGISIQVGVTEPDPAAKALRMAQEHCAKRGKNAVLSNVRDQVIFDYRCG